MVLAVSGCARLNPGTDEAATVAQQFHDRLAVSDEQAACALLAPTTVEEIEAGQPDSCPAHLAALDLPAASEVRQAQAYGSNARVRLDADTVFLTRSGDGWTITAAGCIPRGERPYDCEVKGS